MNRQDYEKREDYVSDPDPAFVQTYEITQEYDKLYPTRGNKFPLAGCPMSCPPAHVFNSEMLIKGSDVVPDANSLGCEQSGDRVRYAPPGVFEREMSGIGVFQVGSGLAATPS